MLGNGSMKPSILRAHFTLSPSTHVHDDHTFLLAKRTQFCAAGKLQNLGFVSEDKLMLEASYRVAWRIAKDRKSHTIGERLIKPCSMDMVEFVRREEQKKLRKIFCQTIQYIVV